MPTLVLLPSTTELLCVTTASAPIAVAFVIPDAPFEKAPMKVLRDSLVLELPASFPKYELLVPVLLNRPAKKPKDAFWEPSLFLSAAKRPKAAFLEPVVFDKPASAPKKALFMPEIL